MNLLSDWLYSSPDAYLMVILTGIGIYLALVVFTRLMGLRSFSKMSSFDFAITVAFGSIIGTTLIVEDPPLLQAVIGLATLFVVQYVVSQLRRADFFPQNVFDNQPLLIMAGSEILEQNLAKAKMTRTDLIAKLREANVISRDQIRAVVMETTGDVSVLHAGSDGPDLELSLFEGVRDAERLEDLANTKTQDTQIG